MPIEVSTAPELDSSGAGAADTVLAVDVAPGQVAQIRLDQLLDVAVQLAAAGPLRYAGGVVYTVPPGSGANNQAIGSGALDALTTGARSTGFGDGAGSAITENNDLTAVGYNAAAVATVTCTAVGSGALDAMTSGVRNTAVGYNAAGTVITGNDNTAVGNNALSTATTSNNTAVGSGALEVLTTGSSNTAVGSAAVQGGGGATTCDRCTGVGMGALQNITTGADNTAIGQAAGNSITQGSRNTLIGRNADLSTLTTGNDNTLIGVGANVSTAAASFQTAVGAGAVCTANSQVMLGRSSDEVLCPGKLAQGATAGGATSTSRVVHKKTGIADNTATAILTVTVPNANHAACIKLRFLSSNGSTDAFESSRCAEGMVVLARTSGVDTVAAVAALTLAQIATVGGGATHTLAYDITSMTGAADASQTFDIRVTVDDSGNLGSNQVVVLAEVMNSEASGVTIAAA